MRNNLSILLTLSALLMFTGCGSNSDTSGTLVNAGETVEVLPGDTVKPVDAGTQIKVNDTASNGNTTVTVISGSALLIKN